MSREQERISKRLEKKPVLECNWVQQKFYPELYYKCIAVLPSMQEMTREFNKEAVVKNLYWFLGSGQKKP